MNVKNDIEKLFKKNKLWPQVHSVIKKCLQSGFPTYVVGGAIRDASIGKIPEDFDIATSAHPEKLKKLFPRSYFVGQSFGVIWLPLAKEKGVEIATFRKEGVYLDGRRPSEVEFCSIEEDVKRRDFTINALYYDVEKKVIIDFVDGLKDLDQKQIKTVGSPEKRFQEDKLRILRAVRFSSILDFSIEEKTLQAVKKFIPDIHQISKERICDEMEKTFEKGNFSKTMDFFIQINLFEILWPQWPWDDHSIWSKNKNCSCILCVSYNDLKKHSGLLIFLWALIFSPAVLKIFNKENKEHLGENLKKAFQEIRLSSQKIKRIIKFYFFYFDILSQDVRLGKKLRLLDEEYGFIYFNLALHIVSSRSEDFENLKKLWKIYQKKSSSGNLPEPFLKNQDFLQEGVPQGPQISKLFEYFYNEQLEGKIKNREESLKLFREGQFEE